MAARWEVLDDRAMIGLRSEHARLDVKTAQQKSREANVILCRGPLRL
jgi:hypothetical protein